MDYKNLSYATYFELKNNTETYKYSILGSKNFKWMLRSQTLIKICHNFWLIICSPYRDFSLNIMDIVSERQGIEIIVLIVDIILNITPELREVSSSFDDDDYWMNKADQEVVYDKMD